LAFEKGVLAFQNYTHRNAKHVRTAWSLLL
jgi:hypothetical protein